VRVWGQAPAPACGQSVAAMNSCDLRCLHGAPCFPLTVSGYRTGRRKLTAIDLRMKDLPCARRNASDWAGPSSSWPMEDIHCMRPDSKKRTCTPRSERERGKRELGDF
jgi:hypothetical protein